MNTTLSQQIKAVQKARALLKGTDRKELDACLNDAASTIAALNLTKDVIESLNKRCNALEEALEPFEKLADACWADSRELKSNTLYQFNAAAITFEDLMRVKNVLNP